MNENACSKKHKPIISGPISLLLTSVMAFFVTNKAINVYREKFTLHQNIITTRGICSKVVKSNEATIEVTIYNETNDLNSINAKRTSDCESMISYLEKSGIKRSEILSVICSHQDQINDYITSYRYYNDESTKHLDNQVAMNVLKRFKVVDKITIKTTDVDLAEKISANTIEYAKLHPDVYFTISTDYRYTELDNLRIQMIDEATKDACNRTEKIISHTNNRLGKLTGVSVSRFDINAYGVLADSDSSYVSENKSKLKNISVVVTINRKIL